MKCTNVFKEDITMSQSTFSSPLGGLVHPLNYNDTTVSGIHYIVKKVELSGDR